MARFTCSAPCPAARTSGVNNVSVTAWSSASTEKTTPESKACATESNGRAPTAASSATGAGERFHTDT
ncbi:Uncharacterised protein [Mycobacteroides abscessus subsp. abscessus]|nr:Uncharacterised protein [Mycobacteroides abscessus subsp. abscessus]